MTEEDRKARFRNLTEQMVESYRKFGCVTGYRGHGIRFRNGALAPYRSWMRSKF